MKNKNKKFKIIAWLRHQLNVFVMRHFPKRAPYKGICAHCGKKVYHYYPWFTKNPERNEDAQPLHEDCAKHYLFGA